MTVDDELGLPVATVLRTQAYQRMADVSYMYKYQDTHDESCMINGVYDSEI